ncbi:hypothetical protein [Sphingomonas sp. UYP23]
MSGTHVYTLFDQDTDQIVAVGCSLVGVGLQTLADGRPKVFLDGEAVTLDRLVERLTDQASVMLMPSDGTPGRMRIERHLLLP